MLVPQFMLKFEYRMQNMVLHEPVSCNGKKRRDSRRDGSLVYGSPTETERGKRGYELQSRVRLWQGKARQSFDNPNPYLGCLI